MAYLAENVAIIDTLTNAKLAVIASGIEVVQTFAYAMEQDGGGATYRRLDAQPSDHTNRGYFQDSAGTWFALTSLDANVRMFGCVGDGITNDQTSFQNAIDYAFNVLNTNLYVPSGTYQVETLMLPGRTNPPSIDHRNRRFKLFGQGIGEGYAIFGGSLGYGEEGGTKIIGATNATVLTCDDVYPLGGSSGLEICDLCFIAKGAENPNPVVELRLVQNSSFHHNILYQEGVGDGLHILMAYQTDIAWNRIFNKWWTLQAPDRTGIGIRLFTDHSPSQVTIRNNTSRTFEHAGILGDIDGTHAQWQLLLLYNEASGCTNGWTLHRCDGALVMGNYVEGPKGGFGFKDLSREVNYIGNFIFEGCSIGFDFTDTICRGHKVSNSIIKLGNKSNAVGIHVNNNTPLDWSYSIIDNFFEITSNTPGSIGILVEGQSASVNISGNEFNPRQQGWGGAGSHKIKIDVAEPGLIGFVQHSEDAAFVAYQAINNGQITYSSGKLQYTDFSGQVLTVGPRNYYVVDTASQSASFNRISRQAIGDTTQVTLRLVSANVSVTQSGYVRLASGSTFTGPGSITFAVSRLGGNDYAYEIARTSY